MGRSELVASHLFEVRHDHGPPVFDSSSRDCRIARHALVRLENGVYRAEHHGGGLSRFHHPRHPAVMRQLGRQ